MVSVSKWRSHNEQRHTYSNAITNKYVAWKHGPVVAAVLSRAQHNQENIWNFLLYSLLLESLQGFAIFFQAQEKGLSSTLDIIKFSKKNMCIFN